MHYVSLVNRTVQIKFGQRPIIGLKHYFKTEVKSKLLYQICRDDLTLAVDK